MIEHGTYAGELLGAALTIGVGLGLLFVPLSLVALAHVGEADTGVASSLLNAGRQVGAAIGLAVLGTVAWTVVANGSRAHAAAGPTTRTAVAQAAYRHAQAAYRHALAAGFDRAFLVGAGIAVLLLVIAIVAIRVRRADLNGS
jgi:hypothetical protein